MRQGIKLQLTSFMVSLHGKTKLSITHNITHFNRQQNGSRQVSRKKMRSCISLQYGIQQRNAEIFPLTAVMCTNATSLHFLMRFNFTPHSQAPGHKTFSKIIPNLYSQSPWHKLRDSLVCLLKIDCPALDRQTLSPPGSHTHVLQHSPGDVRTGQNGDPAGYCLHVPPSPQYNTESLH